MIAACKNTDHPISVAKVIMTIKKGQEELDQFTLTRNEYAKELGRVCERARYYAKCSKNENAPRKINRGI
jgi:hypothetical protein